MINVIIIDDHVITRMGLKVMLKDIFSNMQLDEAKNGTEAITLIKSKPFHLCLMDLNMPGTDSMELLKKLKDLQPEMKILVVSMNSEEVYAVNVLKKGAMGFVSKENGYEEIKGAIQKIMNNKKYMSEKVISLLLEDDNHKDEQNPFTKLSERELEVAKLICEGYSTKEIGNKTNLQLSTISTYKAKIFEKLQIKNVVELIEISRVHKVLGLY